MSASRDANSELSQDTFYQQIVDEYGPALNRLACGYENNFDKRRDLLQEIHFQLWRSLQNYDSRCSLRTWVYRVAHNVATSHSVRQRRRNSKELLTLEEAEEGFALEDVEAYMDRQRALARLLTLIQKLQPLDRQLILAYLEGLDAESIAEITGISVTNTWTKIHRIKNVLARQFHAGDIRA